MMCGAAGCKPGHHAGSELRFARISEQSRLPLQHVDELVLTRMPVMECRNATRAKASEVHAKALEAKRIAKRVFDPSRHARGKRFRVIARLSPWWRVEGDDRWLVVHGAVSFMGMPNAT
jgi:hypothetical protein